MNIDRVHTLFLDVGGVLLSNGWDRTLRKKAAATFDLDLEEMEERHVMIFDDFEKGKIPFKDYLKHIIFFKWRSFTVDDVKEFIFNAAVALPDMLELVRMIKQSYPIKIAILSNEGAEIARDRFEKFHFNDFVDYYIVSSAVGLRKPDQRIFKLALGLCQVPANKVLFIDDRAENVEAAKRLGIFSICHKDFASTKQALGL